MQLAGARFSCPQLLLSSWECPNGCSSPFPPWLMTVQGRFYDAASSWLTFPASQSTSGTWARPDRSFRRFWCRAVAAACFSGVTRCPWHLGMVPRFISSFSVPRGGSWFLRCGAIGIWGQIYGAIWLCHVVATDCLSVLAFPGTYERLQMFSRTCFRPFRPWLLTV